MSKFSAPIISNVSVTPASGPGGTTFAATVTVSGFPSPRISYEWRLDGANISGATGSSYTASVAGNLTVFVTAVNNQGSDSRESAVILVTHALAAPKVTEARIAPTAGEVGDDFTAIAEATGVPVPDLFYQWMLDGSAIGGATAASYTAAAKGALTVRVTARNSEGVDSRDSDAVAVAGTAVAPEVTDIRVSPETGRVGDVFTADASVSGSPAPELRYQWLHDGATIAGATGVSHLAEVEGLLSVRVTATSTAGSAGGESAGVVVEAALAAPQVETADIVPSAGRVGDTFTATATATGNPAPQLEYQWRLDGAAIEGATGASFTAWATGMLHVRVTATNLSGTDSRESGKVQVEDALAAPQISAATILPEAGRVGDMFTVTATVSGNPAPTLSYQWTLDGTAIEGATEATHTAAAEGRLGVVVTATSSQGIDTRAADDALVGGADYVALLDGSGSMIVEDATMLPISATIGL